MQQVGFAGYRAARLFVAAMNIGSAGFWWWERPDQSGKFYQRISDLKAPAGMTLDLKIHAGPPFEWKRDALKENNLARIGLCLGMACRLPDAVYNAIIEAYFTGLALIAKSDVHLVFAPQACERFAACLCAAMRHFGDWDGTDEGLAVAVAASFPFEKPEDGEELIGLLRQLRRQSNDFKDLALERAAILKFLTDVYLIRRFEAVAQAGTPASPAGLSRAEPREIPQAGLAGLGHPAYIARPHIVGRCATTFPCSSGVRPLP
jgi:hypothetical protein